MRKIFLQSALTAGVAAIALLAAPDSAQAQIPFNGHTYQLTSAQLSWTAAEAEAVSLGGHLVAINDAAENEFVRFNFGANFTPWIGLTDQAVEGVFVWSNGDPVTFTNWNGGEPNNVNNEDYAQMLSSGLWNDLPDGSTRFGVVEIAPSGAAPEPGTLALIGTGLMGAAGVALRRRSRKS